MKPILSKLVFVLFLSLFAFASYAQDTATAETYDIVYRKEGGAIWGTIMSFDEPTGLLVFKDRSGRIYSLGREEYDYFRENQVYTPRKKKTRVVHPRKVDDFEYSLGFGWTYLDGPDYNYFTDNSESYSWFSYVPVTVKVAAGKRFSDTYYLGGTAEFSIASSLTNYLNGGVRYAYTFSSNKRNVLLYLPAELKYYTMKATKNVYTLDDPNAKFNMNLSSVGLSLGTGISIQRPNLKSLSLELKVTRHFATQFDITNMPETVNYGIGERRLGSASVVFMYNL
jgi:hypothetical protein